jgi:hypothetical protein
MRSLRWRSLRVRSASCQPRRSMSAACCLYLASRTTMRSSRWRTTSGRRERCEPAEAGFQSRGTRVCSVRPRPCPGRPRMSSSGASPWVPTPCRSAPGRPARWTGRARSSSRRRARSAPDRADQRGEGLAAAGVDAELEASLSVGAGLEQGFGTDALVAGGEGGRRTQGGPRCPNPTGGCRRGRSGRSWGLPLLA